jgi:hypothetical protein
MARKFKLNATYMVGAVLAVLALYVVYRSTTSVSMGCPGSQVYCPGVGCVSGMDKCIPGNRGGPSAVFSKESFANNADAPKYELIHREFEYAELPKPPQMKVSFTPKDKFLKCPDNTFGDGQCLMEFQTDRPQR